MGSISLAELIAHGRQSRSERRLDDAKDVFLAAVAMGRKCHETALLVDALLGLAQVERDLKNSVSSIRYYTDAADLLREQDQPLRLAHTVRHVADIEREMGNLEKAAALYEESLTLYRNQPQPPPLDLANAVRGYALLTEARGQDEQATLLWQEALVLYERVGVQTGVAECQSQLAFLLGR